MKKHVEATASQLIWLHDTSTEANPGADGGSDEPTTGSDPDERRVVSLAMYLRDGFAWAKPKS